MLDRLNWRRKSGIVIVALSLVALALAEEPVLGPISTSVLFIISLIVLFIVMIWLNGKRDGKL